MSWRWFRKYLDSQGFNHWCFVFKMVEIRPSDTTQILTWKVLKIGKVSPMWPKAINAFEFLVKIKQLFQGSSALWNSKFHSNSEAHAGRNPLPLSKITNLRTSGWTTLKLPVNIFSIFPLAFNRNEKGSSLILGKERRNCWVSLDQNLACATI